MASAPQPQGLPILYNDLVPLSSNEHSAWKIKPYESFGHIKTIHAVPLIVDEFVVAQRHFPIVFSSGPDPVPLALMGLNEGVNAFVDDNGTLAPGTYLPAYFRRYPFLLARLRPDTDEMTLCFDPSSDALGAYDEGLPLFENGETAQQLKDILAFTEQFEQGAQRTGAFCKDLIESGLIEEGEVSIQPDGAPQPYVYRGFQMVTEAKMRDLRGDQLRKMSQNGMLPLLHAHLFSLGLMHEVFNRQLQQGKIPPQQS